MTKWVTAVVVILGVLGTINSEVTYSPKNSFTFDCRRYINGCASGGLCDIYTGQCICDSDKEGYDCTLPWNPQSGFVQSCNSIPCSTEGGMCYHPRRIGGPSELCYCRTEYTGYDCSQRRAMLRCSRDTMHIELYPQKTLSEPFRGKLAIQTFDTAQLLMSQECSMDTDPRNGVDWDLQKLYKDISTADNGPCRRALRLVEHENGLTYCYLTRLMYAFGLVTASDELYQFCCSFTGAVSTSIEVVHGPVASINVTAHAKPLIYEMRWTDGGRIIANTEIVRLGNAITFVARLNTTVTSGRDFRLNTCTARARASPAEVDLIRNRCRTSEARPLVRNVTQKIVAGGLKEIHVDLNAFRLEGSGKINITCDFSICLTTCGRVSQCVGSDFLSYGRRKRSANESAPETETEEEDGDVLENGSLSIQYILGDPDGDVCPTYKAIVEPTQCIQEETFIAVVVALGVLLLICLVICVAVTCWACKKHKGSKSRVVSMASN